MKGDNMNNRTVVLVLSAVLIAAVLSGCVQEVDKTAPLTEMEVSLSISNAPALNQTAELTCTVTSIKDAPNTMAQIKLPEGFELVSGDLLWRGDVTKSSQKSFNATIKSVKTGNWTIEAIAESKLEDGKPSEFYRATDHVHIVLGNITASISKTPPSMIPSKGETVADWSKSRELGPMGPNTHIGAISMADGYLNKNLGSSFVSEHFECLGIEKHSSAPHIWWIIYKYRSNEYEMNMSITISTDVGLGGCSGIIASPQEITLSAEDAEAIASDKGLESPKAGELWVTARTNRIAWIVTTQKKALEIMETRSYYIDAENGDILGEGKYVPQMPLPEESRNKTRTKPKFIPYSEIMNETINKSAQG